MLLLVNDVHEKSSQSVKTDKFWQYALFVIALMLQLCTHVTWEYTHFQPVMYTIIHETHLSWLFVMFFFSCKLIISNNMIFSCNLVQISNCTFFKDNKLHSPVVFAKFTPAYRHQIALDIMLLPIPIQHIYLCGKCQAKRNVKVWNTNRLWLIESLLGLNSTQFDLLLINNSNNK